MRDEMCWGTCSQVQNARITPVTNGKEDDRRKNLVKASLEMLAFRYVVKEKPYDNYSYRYQQLSIVRDM